MNQILQTKLFLLSHSFLRVVILCLLFATDGRWFGFIAGVLLVDGLISLWLQLRKNPNLTITDDIVLVCGLKLNRADIQAWRVFRSSGDGEKSRYIEIQLKRVPPYPWRWKLAKLFESVPAIRRLRPQGRFASEPRIIAALCGRDLTNDEIRGGLGDGEDFGRSGGDNG